jgi:carboxyl-terminal processing protease
LIRRNLVLGGLLGVLFGLGWWVGRGSATDSSDLYQNLDVFIEVLQRVEQNYVDPVEPGKLIEGAVRGMLRDLDPYSQFLDARSWDNLKATTHGSFGGIGVVVTVRDNYPTVVSPVEGGPSWTMGLRSGDVIVRIDGQSSAGLTVEEVANRLRGPQGSRVRITVRREGENEEREYTIERELIVTKSVPYAFLAGDHVGYLRLATFSESSGSEVRTALARLREQGATRLVLDLRLNPGGLLDQAVDVAEQFLKPNTLVVQTKGRARGQDHKYFSAETRPLLEWPVVVLVDGASASASEIVAGALQDLDRALVVGQNTFGKGSVQNVYPLQGRTVALKLTTAKYYTPTGRSIHKNGMHARLAALDSGQDELDESEEEAVEPDGAASDTAQVIAFRTAAGRVVYGGGGIRPDQVVRADSLSPLMREVEGRGLAFRFANRWINRHPDWKASSPVSDPLRREFADFLRAERIAVAAPELEASRPRLERALRRELARRLAGDGAAARVALEGDPLYRRALEVLSRARTAREVFASAPLPAGSVH